jgi:hypothetical protein
MSGSVSVAVSGFSGLYTGISMGIFLWEGSLGFTGSLIGKEREGKGREGKGREGKERAPLSYIGCVVDHLVKQKLMACFVYLRFDSIQFDSSVISTGLELEPPSKCM